MAKQQFRVVNGEVEIRDKPVLERVNKGKCYFCKEDVYVAQGQLYKLFRKQPSHKRCRP